LRLSKHPVNLWAREAILTNARGLGSINVLSSRPTDLRLPLTQWSAPKVTACRRAHGLLQAIASEWVRQLLRREGATSQRARTWTSPPNLAFEAKSAHPPCPQAAAARRGADQFRAVGPLELRPMPKLAWPRQVHRQAAATYGRTRGTEQFLRFSDVQMIPAIWSDADGSADI